MRRSWTGRAVIVVSLIAAFALGVLAQRSGLFDQIAKYRSDILFLSKQHMQLVAISGGLAIAIGVPLGLWLSRPGMRRLGFYRTLYFLPVVTLPASVALMWKLLYSGDYGIINWLLGLVQIEGPYWLSDPNTALFAIAVVSVWSSVGYNMVILLAGMQTIPRDY